MRVRRQRREVDVADAALLAAIGARVDHAAAGRAALAHLRLHELADAAEADSVSGGAPEGRVARIVFCAEGLFAADVAHERLGIFARRGRSLRKRPLFATERVAPHRGDANLDSTALYPLHFVKAAPQSSVGVGGVGVGGVCSQTKILVGIRN